MHTLPPTAGGLRVPSELTDGVVLLRPFTDADVPALVRIVSDPDIRARSSVPEATEAEVAAWLAHWHALAVAGRGVQLAVCDALSGRLAGRRRIRLLPEAGRAGFGCWIDRDWRGRRFAPRSARLLAAWAFAHWPVDRIDAECGLDNAASFRSLLAAGFRHEGVGPASEPEANGSRPAQHRFRLAPGDL